MVKAKLQSPCHLRTGAYQEKVGQEILAKLPFVNRTQPVIQGVGAQTEQPTPEWPVGRSVECFLD